MGREGGSLGAAWSGWVGGTPSGQTDRDWRMGGAWGVVKRSANDREEPPTARPGWLLPGEQRSYQAPRQCAIFSNSAATIGEAAPGLARHRDRTGFQQQPSEFAPDCRAATIRP